MRTASFSARRASCKQSRQDVLFEAMAYGHSSRLLPLEAPVMMAEKHKFFLSFLSFGQACCGRWMKGFVP